MTSHAVWRSILDVTREQECLLRRSSPICAFLSARCHAPKPETFFKLLENWREFLKDVFERGTSEDTLLGIQALEDTLMIKHIVGDDFLKQSLQLLCELVQRTEDEKVAEHAAAVIGAFLSKSGGALSNQIEDQVVWALGCLESNASSHHKKRNAVILLRSIAEQSPAAFNIHVQKFLGLIWKGLAASDLNLRIKSAKSVGACLRVIEQRKTRNRVIWFNRLANNALKGLEDTHDVASVHGSLMVISELITHSGEFMLARYEQVACHTLVPRLQMDRHVKRVILELIPQLADFCPERFFDDNEGDDLFGAAMTTILSVSRDGNLEAIEEEKASIRSLKGLTTALKSLEKQKSLLRWIHEIALKFENVFKKITDAHCHQEGLECCGVLALCLVSEWKPYAERLLMPMVMTGISHALAHCLRQTMENIPELGTTIQECLLDALYLLLIDVPCTDMIPSDLQDRIRGLRSPEMVVVALEVLSDFDFGDRDLLSFAKEHVYHILSESPTCRVRAAALTSSIQIARKNKDSDSVLSLLEDVMTLGVSDTNDCVRYSLWKALLDCPELDSSLLNCNASVVLLLGLGDPSMEVQFIALKLIGRLIGMGGDFLEDVVLEKMHQLLQQLELSFDKERNQVCTEVLSQLIQSCPSVVTPRANVITKTLIHLLKRQLQPPARSEPTGDSEERNPSPKWLKERFLWTSTGVVAAALQTVGHLADHAGSFIDKDVLQTLLELTVAALQKTEIEKDSIEAVRTLGKVVSSTGAVDRPYHQFSWLLLRLLDMLQVDDREVRTTVARTLGVLCAIDPSSQRRIQAQASGEGRLELEGVRPIKKPKDDSELESTPEKATMDLLVSSGGQNSEESYSLFAMTALLKVLKQRSLSAFHRDAVCVLGRIISSLSVSCVQYLNILVPNWCDAVYSGDEDIKHHILREFIRLVTIYKQYIRLFLKHLMKLIRDLWTVNCTKETLLNLMQLLKEVASICRHDMEGYFSWLVPKMLLLLETESWELIPVALDTIVELGPALHRHLHQILPTIARLALSPCMRGRERIQTAILCALEQICHILSVPELAGTVFTPLMTLLQRMECDKDKAVDVLAAAIYAGRLDSKAFRPIKALVQSKNIRNKKLNVLSVNMFRSRSRDLDLNGAWRASFEKPVSLVLTERQDDNQERRPHFSDRDLRQVWNAEQRYTYQDWLEWMRENTLELLRSSPSPALRACHDFAVNIPSVAKDLFSASFVSCWSELVPDVQKEFIRHLEAAMANISIPPEILTTLLNLAEFMEHNGYQLPLDRRTLAALSMKCQAFAKALHYKEMEFQDSPEQAVDIMLAIYNQCFLPASANGFLNYARDVLNMEIKDSWYEKLHKWETALLMYQQRAEEPLVEIEQAIEANLGCIRCHSALWQWAELNKLCQKQWAIADPTIRKQIAPYAAQAAWKMDEWEAMSDYLKAVDVDEDNSADASTCAFLCSVNKIHFHQFEEAQTFIDKARLFLSADLAALSGESYERAYEKMVRVQQLSELEEAIQIIRSKEKGNSERQQRIIEFWTKRLSAVQKRADVWESCLSVRSLVISPENDLLTWMKFAAMCRKQDRAPFAKSLLIKLLGYDPITVPKGAIGYGAGSGKPEVMFAYLKHVFGTSEDNSDIEQDAIDRLKDMIDHDNLEIWFASKPNGLEIAVPSVPLISRACVVLSKWKQKMNFRESLNQSEHIQTLIDLSNRACYYAKDWAKAWRDWAVHHLIAVDHYKASSDLASKYVAPAVRGFFQALKLSQESALRGGMLGSGPSKDTYQDILRLLTLWFSHGDAPNVIDELTKGFGMVRIETWIVVIPQIIARIHVQSSHVQELIHQLLKKIGQAHPQALLYPILVASYNVNGRRSVPSEALELMRLTYPALVNEGELIGRRFVDIAVLWDERWHEALEEASKCYFNEMDIPQMLNVLLPLHQELESFAAMTNSEQRFRNTYSNPLNEAYQLLSRYSEDNDQTLIQKAWDIYYSIFRKIDRSIRDMMVLHLSDVAPDLLDRSMSVAIPGTYSPFNSEQVCIDRIVPEIQVLNTKQRPRKLTIEGNDGNDYIFLLKGHEDLRQDERVMQLFGLVNTILASDFNSCEQELSIARYAVTPLSPNVGLIGWVPNCDTLHALIKEYREVKGIPINTEHQLMKGFAPNCENLMLIQKVEVFRYALDATVGDDLKTIMWMKSSSSEHWLAHRTNYIRSCAVMSIVGYFLGLGDRHPSNLMIDRYTGKLVHIDFGDCFESGMHREKFPEKVPFRLTRMMVKAMEVTGIEGTFRKTCELVMQVLRGEKQTLMAMLEAFVYDPLINWRLALPTTQDEETSLALAEDAHQMLNERALSVTDRIKLKLSGRELDPENVGLSVEDQVDYLINEATSHVNLCQAFIGWCPFW